MLNGMGMGVGDQNRWQHHGPWRGGFPNLGFGQQAPKPALQAPQLQSATSAGAFSAMKAAGGAATFSDGTDALFDQLLFGKRELRPKLAGFQLPSGVSQLLEGAKHHLPSIRLPDSVVGTGLGALGGLGVAATRDALKGDEEESPSYLTHALAGGAVGFGAGNLVGDRARRYVANNLPLHGYNETISNPERSAGRIAGLGHTPSRASFLKPRSLSHLWRTAVLDQPDNDLSRLIRGGNSTESFETAARRELLRRHLGVPVRPESAIFQSTGKRDFVPTTKADGNPLSGGIPGRYDHVELSPGIVDRLPPEQASQLKKLLEYAKTQAHSKYRVKNVWSSFLARHGFETPQPGQARVFDHWDFGLSPEEREFVRKNWPKLLQNSTQALPGAERKQLEAFGDAGRFDSATGPDYGAVLKPLVLRYLLNDVIGKGGVVFDQNLDVSGEGDAAVPIPSPLIPQSKPTVAKSGGDAGIGPSHAKEVGSPSFGQAFVSRCEQLGLSKVAMDALVPLVRRDFGADAATEIEQALDKQAGVGKVLKGLWNAARPATKAVGQAKLPAKLPAPLPKPPLRAPAAPVPAPVANVPGSSAIPSPPAKLPAPLPKPPLRAPAAPVPAPVANVPGSSAIPSPPAKPGFLAGVRQVFANKPLSPSERVWLGGSGAMATVIGGSAIQSRSQPKPAQLSQPAGSSGSVQPLPPPLPPPPRGLSLEELREYYRKQELERETKRQQALPSLLDAYSPVVDSRVPFRPETTPTAPEYAGGVSANLDAPRGVVKALAHADVRKMFDTTVTDFPPDRDPSEGHRRLSHFFQQQDHEDQRKLMASVYGNVVPAYSGVVTPINHQLYYRLAARGFHPTSDPEESARMVRERNRQVPNLEYVPGSEITPTRAAVYYTHSGTVTLPAVRGAYGNSAAPVNHELEHARTLGSGERVARIGSPRVPLPTYGSLDLAAEIPASFGDVVFDGERYRRARGKPVDVKLELGRDPQDGSGSAENRSLDVDWMVEQAKRHGYFQGRTMTDLLATPEGQQFLRRQLESMRNWKVQKTSQDDKYEQRLRQLRIRRGEDPETGEPLSDFAKQAANFIGALDDVGRSLFKGYGDDLAKSWSKPRIRVQSPVSSFPPPRPAPMAAPAMPKPTAVPRPAPAPVAAAPAATAAAPVAAPSVSSAAPKPQPQGWWNKAEAGFSNLQTSASAAKARAAAATAQVRKAVAPTLGNAVTTGVAGGFAAPAVAGQDDKMFDPWAALASAGIGAFGGKPNSVARRMFATPVRRAAAGAIAGGSADIVGNQLHDFTGGQSGWDDSRGRIWGSRLGGASGTELGRRATVELRKALPQTSRVGKALNDVAEGVGYGNVQALTSPAALAGRSRQVTRALSGTQTPTTVPGQVGKWLGYGAAVPTAIAGAPVAYDWAKENVLHPTLRWGADETVAAQNIPGVKTVDEVKPYLQEQANEVARNAANQQFAETAQAFGVGGVNSPETFRDAMPQIAGGMISAATQGKITSLEEIQPLIDMVQSGGKEGGFASAILGQLGQIPDQILGLFMDPARLSKMSAPEKWMLLVGGGLGLVGGVGAAMGSDYGLPAMVGGAALGAAGLFGKQLMPGFSNSQGAAKLDELSPEATSRASYLPPTQQHVLAPPQAPAYQPQQRNEFQFQAQRQSSQPFDFPSPPR